jgi:Ca2+-binding EF-hand superfamily protein
MNKSLIIGLSAMALATSGAAYAHNHGGDMMGDADGNGVMTRAEAQAGAAAMFAKMDANNDGALTPADREARMAEHRAQMFAMMDTDKNGQISRNEFMAHKHEGMRGDKDGKGHKMGMRGRGGGMMMQKADANNDGRVTKAEFTAAAMTRFDRADANKDGQVTSDERKAMREEMRGKWRAMKQGGDAS